MSEILKKHEEESGSLIANRGDVTLRKICYDSKKLICSVEFDVVRRSNEGSKAYRAIFKPDWKANAVLCAAIVSLRDPICIITNKIPEEYHKVSVTSVSVTNIDDAKKGSFTLGGSEISKSDQKQNFLTHAVNFNNGVYGIEKGVKKIIDEIEGLAFDYIYRQKEAHTPLPVNTSPPKNASDFKAENPAPVEDGNSDTGDDSAENAGSGEGPVKI